MFDHLKVTALGAVAAVTLAVAAPHAEAATTLVDGGVYDLPSAGSVFEGTMDLNLACVPTLGVPCTEETMTGPASIEATFNVDPMWFGTATGYLALHPVGFERFTDLTAEWVNATTGAVLNSLDLVVGSNALTTNFIGDDLSQILRLSWSSLMAPGGTATASMYPAVTIDLAPIPLPATGLLLVGALGATAMLRRRKNKTAA